jgi:hypothetical protein
MPDPPMPTKCTCLTLCFIRRSPLACIAMQTSANGRRHRLGPDHAP